MPSMQYFGGIDDDILYSIYPLSIEDWYDFLAVTDLPFFHTFRETCIRNQNTAFRYKSALIRRR